MIVKSTIVNVYSTGHWTIGHYSINVFLVHAKSNDCNVYELNVET
jgi:hypothetical protein